MADDPARNIVTAIAILDAVVAWAEICRTVEAPTRTGDLPTHNRPLPRNCGRRRDKQRQARDVGRSVSRDTAITEVLLGQSLRVDTCHDTQTSNMRHSRSQAAVSKDPIYPGADESSVTMEQLAAAIRAAAAMDIKKKVRVCDTIHATQPNLLASVLALRSFGISMQTIEIVLNILIVLHLAIVESGQVLATVTEDDQERELSRYTASVNFAEGPAAASFKRSLEQSRAYRKERYLFAFVLSTLMSSGIATQKEEKAKYPMLAAINLVNCIATAKRVLRR